MKYIYLIMNEGRKVMETKITKEQIKNIQIDHGILFRNYGVEGQELIAPLRGGTNFKVERTYRNIDYDGSKGKTKGLKTIDDENATLTAKTLNCSLQTFADKLPGAKVTRDNQTKKITKIEAGKLGIIAEDDYITNITMFAKTIGGEYIKVTITNALDENGLDFSAVQKAEGEIELVYSAHHEYDKDTALYNIEYISDLDLEEM